MKNKCSWAGAALVTLASFCLASPFVHAQEQATSEAETSPSSDSPIKISLFADRVTLKEGEHITIKAWVESKIVDSVTVSVFFAEDQLNLVDSTSHQVFLPIDSLATFTLVGERPGKSNLLVQVSGVSRNTNEIVRASQQIQGIEVTTVSQGWNPIISGSLLGVFIGALLTFLTTLFTTLFNDRRQKRKEKSKRMQWIIAQLPAQLESNRIAIVNEHKTGFEQWMSKLLTEGYYTDLKHLEKEHPDIGDLAQALIQVGADLESYEIKLTKDLVSADFKDSLVMNLSIIIQKLSRISRHQDAG